MTLVPAATDLLAEADRSRQKYGPYTSSHEAYGVLAEEMAELLEAIHANSWPSIQREALQVAAVALRLSHEIEHEAQTRERSGCA